MRHSRTIDGFSVLRVLAGVALLGSIGFLLWRFFLPLLDLRIHAVSIAIASVYLGLGDVLAWNTIANLDKVVSDTKALPLPQLLDLVNRVKNDRKLMLQRIGVIVFLKGVAVAVTPAVFAPTVSDEVKMCLVSYGYVIVLVSIPLLVLMFRDYEKAARFRDVLLFDDRAAAEAAAKKKNVSAVPHEFSTDPASESYYRVVEPEHAGR